MGTPQESPWGQVLVLARSLVTGCNNPFRSKKGEQITRDPGDGKSGMTGSQEDGTDPLSLGWWALGSVYILFTSDFLGVPAQSG